MKSRKLQDQTLSICLVCETMHMLTDICFFSTRLKTMPGEHKGDKHCQISNFQMEAAKTASIIARQIQTNESEVRDWKRTKRSNYSLHSPGFYRRSYILKCFVQFSFKWFKQWSFHHFACRTTPCCLDALPNILSLSLPMFRFMSLFKTFITPQQFLSLPRAYNLPILHMVILLSTRHHLTKLYTFGPECCDLTPSIHGNQMAPYLSQLFFLNISPQNLSHYESLYL